MVSQSLKRLWLTIRLLRIKWQLRNVKIPPTNIALGLWRPTFAEQIAAMQEYKKSVAARGSRRWWKLWRRNPNA
jgi:hypothetical protein